MDIFALFIIIVIIVTGAVGWRKGFVSQISQFVGLLLAIAACRIFGPAVCRILGDDSLAITLIAYVLIFIVVFFGVWICGNLLRGTMRVLRMGIVNRLGGIVFSVCKWLIFISLLLNVYAVISPANPLASSKIYDKVLKFGPALLGTDIAQQIGQEASDIITG